MCESTHIFFVRSGDNGISAGSINTTGVVVLPPTLLIISGAAVIFFYTSVTANVINNKWHSYILWDQCR
jgi:hypothetical protein